MSKPAHYIFKNEILDKETIIHSAIDNSPTSAGEKIKEAFMQYGQPLFDPEEIVEIFQELDSYSICNKVAETYGKVIKEDMFSYVVSAVAAKGNKKPNIKIQVWKKNRRIFSGSIKNFFEKAEKIENTYLS